MGLHDIGGFYDGAKEDTDYKVCPDCGAHRFMDENFSTCCMNGKLKKLIKEVKDAKQSDHPLAHLLYGKSEKPKLFRKHSRGIQNLFAFGSRCMSKKKSKSSNGQKNEASATVKVNEDIYYCLPEKLIGDDDPRFASTYFLDKVQQLERRYTLAKEKKCTLYQNLTANQTKMMDKLIPEIQEILHTKNELCKMFNLLKTKLENDPTTEFVINFKHKYKIPEGEHVRRYNDAHKNVFCAFVPDDHGRQNKSIIYVKNPKKGKKQYIHECNPLFDAIHYSLLFPTGKLGWYTGMERTDTNPTTKPKTKQTSNHRTRINSERKQKP